MSRPPRYQARPDLRRGLLARVAHLARKPWRLRRIARSADRVILVREILPLVAADGGQILWVGVRRYTRAYPAMLERVGGTCWTTDIDPRAARWGRPGRHIVADLTEIDASFQAESFQAVLCNGVFGWGLNELGLQAKALKAMRAILAPGGLLLMGWNHDRSKDPAEAAANAGFEPCGLGALPPRLEIAGTTHVYRFFRRV